MAMTVMITRDVADRYRGFLASVMPEIAPGVYVSPDLNKRVRERTWKVISAWWANAHGGSIIMAWKDKSEPGDLAILTLGTPPVSLAEIDGLLVVRKKA